MAGSGGMSQLLKGIIIGIVLILAIVGTMSLFDKESDNNNLQTNAPASQAKPIEAPSISINPTNNSSNTQQIEQTTDTISSTEAEKPEIIEEPEIVEENKPEPIQYGMLSLSSINADNQQALKADYVVYDKDEVKVAESKNAENTSYRLPAGEYKVVTTLVNEDKNTGREVPVVSKSQIITVSADDTTEQRFQLEPPPTIGILQVSAKVNDRPIRANFIVQKESGETVASRNNVTNSLFKLDAGSYKVTVRSGANTDFRTVVVDGGESTEETFSLQESSTQGRVLIRVFDTRSSTPVRADIAISDANGNVVQNLKSVVKTELSLAAGNYSVKVTGPNGQSTKRINVTANQPVNEIFRFDAPQTPEDNTVVNTDNTVITDTPANTNNTTANDPDAKGTLRLIALNEKDRKGLKSNFYIQTLAGKHLDKRIYKDKAEFSLPAGTYKVTVRSKNRKNQVKNIQVIPNQLVSEVFLMTSSLNNQQATQQQTPARNVTTAPPKPVRNPAIIPNGFLNVSMVPGHTRPLKPGELNTRFIVTNSAGQKIADLKNVPRGRLKLDTGNYTVTAVHKNQKRSKKVTVRQNQNTQVAFNSNEFKRPKGILQSRIVDSAGRPLRGNLTVTSMRGRVVASANNASMGKFELAPRQYRINVNYRGLQGSETISVKSGETTMQTFTIASDQPTINRPANNNQQPDIKDLLKEKLKEELRRNF